MEGVFSYFVAIGAGVATGISIIVVPVMLIYQKLLNRGKKKDAGY